MISALEIKLICLLPVTGTVAHEKTKNKHAMIEMALLIVFGIDAKLLPQFKKRSKKDKKNRFRPLLLINLWFKPFENEDFCNWT